MKRILAKLWEDKTNTFDSKEKMGIWLGVVVSAGLCIVYLIGIMGMCFNPALRASEFEADVMELGFLAALCVAVVAIFIAEKLKRKLENIQKGGI